MTTKEIYKLASELTSKNVENILKGWENEKEEETISTFKTLVRLGDSEQLACATAIAEKYKTKGDSEIYRIAYYS